MIAFAGNFDSNCHICPIHTFPEQEPEAQAIALTPVSASCQQITTCLQDTLTVPQGKPVTTDYPQANVTLYQNGKNQPFASCLVIWQACHLMTRRPYHRWHPEGDYRLYEYQGRSGTLIYRLPYYRDPSKDSIDMRVILIHLLLAACVTSQSRPWAEAIVIHDRIIAEFLGLHQRKDINRIKKLLLIESLVRQACELEVEIRWQQKGKIKSIHLPFAPLWSVQPTYHLSKVEDGSHYLSGISFRFLAGSWSTYFLNQEQARSKTAYYQYGWLPISFAPKIMQLWQRHEGAVVMLLHFLFRLRVGQDRSAKVATLLKLIYGEPYLHVAWYRSEVRRKVITAFESDLEQLFYYGLKPLFENSTYPEEIQPWWISSQNLPDDPDEAFNYWTEAAPGAKTTINSKKKWAQMLNAALTIVEFPEDWRADVSKATLKPRTPSQSSAGNPVTGAMVRTARLKRGLSQRQLSLLLNKSQSWLRDVELDRYKIKPKDMLLLTAVLEDLPPA
ncbi:MAG: hypothetical protein Q6J44_02875 [Gloeomargarita sp. DG02_4_bins_56]